MSSTLARHRTGVPTRVGERQPYVPSQVDQRRLVRRTTSTSRCVTSMRTFRRDDRRRQMPRATQARRAGRGQSPGGSPYAQSPYRARTRYRTEASGAKCAQIVPPSLSAAGSSSSSMGSSAVRSTLAGAGRNSSAQPSRAWKPAGEAEERTSTPLVRHAAPPRRMIEESAPKLGKEVRGRRHCRPGRDGVHSRAC